MIESSQEHAGRRMVFWTWMTLIAVGLGGMIVLPLTGR